MDKQSLRKTMKDRRQALPQETAAGLSQMICDRLLSWPVYKKADVILAYFPCNREADIRPLLETALASGKQVALPRVLGKRHMDFLLIQDFSDLEKGAMGLMEPKKSLPVLNPCYFSKTDRSKNDKIGEIHGKEHLILMLIPGLAFCRTALMAKEVIGRLGYGGGFYDTYLARLGQKRESLHLSASLAACGVAYDFQIIAEDGFPLENHDLFLRYLVTEKSIFGQEE